MNIKTAWAWIITSSKDPSRYSLMVRGALLAIVPTVLSVLSAACGFGLICLGVGAGDLNQVAENVGAIVQSVLTIVAALMFVYGLLRKIYLTATGRFRP